ncbi:PPR containing protein [Actinidia rufa]|uniref:PPR containing protein n=1 Tax=Actinidia rufa TaxID=165716 RepID=A0A7J0H859_9ERIC|nr:PPR containing protein [Actinidia rufa]
MIHNHIEKFGFCSDIFVPNSLIDSYSNCGLIGVHAARKLFAAMEERGIVSWNSVICGLVKAGEMDAAFELFQKMPNRDVVSWSTMICGCCKAGDMEMARIMFDKMPGKNLVRWTIIISGAITEIAIAADSLNSLCAGMTLLLSDKPKKGISCCHLGSAAADDDSKPVHDADWRSFRARLVAREGALRPELGKPSSVVDPDSVLDQPPCVTIGDKWAHTIHRPEKGCLLIATEKLDGSTSSNGRWSCCCRPVRPLFFGGPLEEGLFLVKGGGDGVGRSGVFDEVMKGLYYGTKESVGCAAAEMVKRNVVGVGDFRFFDGYCGWDMEQLMDEVRAGYWTVAACSSSVIGLASIGSVELWEEVLGLVGPKKVW